MFAEFESDTLSDQVTTSTNKFVIFALFAFFAARYCFLPV